MSFANYMPLDIGQTINVVLRLTHTTQFTIPPFYLICYPKTPVARYASILLRLRMCYTVVHDPRTAPSLLTWLLNGTRPSGCICRYRPVGNPDINQWLHRLRILV